ncbi:unnamed protein product [Cladocopium goreaui]|uniref:Protein AF-9 homolog n=1 Tax=Cladocopium goreaui TaxID=2562237 RepID=A0A9P1D5J5_9DINO|nr:unnamed protein product [Cladocopium goreaui]
MTAMTSTDFEVLTNDARSTASWNVVEGSVSGLQAEVALERDVMAFPADDVKAVLSVVAPRVDDSHRAPLRLVAVLDKSGSMNGEKIRLVKQTMIFMLRYLSDKDALGVVEYGSDVKVVAPLTLCDQDGRTRLQHAIERIQISGQTNLSGGLIKGLELHKDNPRHVAAEAPKQPVKVGNTYRRMTPEEAKDKVERGEHFGHPEAAMPSDAERVHEWTMALRFAPEDQKLVKKVVFKLHETFRDPVVEVTTAPFELKRFGWGTFMVKVVIHLQDGRQVETSHMLCFDKPETFRTVLLPLRSPEATGRSESFWGLCGKSSTDQGSEFTVETREFLVETREAVVRSTFLFTDGHANMGITKTEDLCQAASGLLGELKEYKSSISTFGFGADHNADMLRCLADTTTDGTYSHVESEDQIAEAFGEALGGLLSTTHQNVSLMLQLAPNVTFSRAYSSFKPTVEHGVVTLELGDLFSEERRDILVSLRLPDSTSAEGRLEAIGRLEARGFSVISKRSETSSKAVMIERRAVVEKSQMNHQVELHWNRYVTNEALENARMVADRGDLKQAREILDAASVTLGASPLVINGDPICLGLLSDLQDCLGDLQHRDDYFQKGSKKMAMIQGMHAKQRATHGANTSMYTNAVMKEYRAAFKMGIA